MKRTVIHNLVISLLFVMTCLCLPIKATEIGHWHFDNLGSKQIGELTIFDQVEDSSGFVWLATNQGIWRYDGHEFLQFNADSNKIDSLLSNLVLSAWLAPDGKIWLGTNKGLSIFDPAFETFTNYQHDPQLPFSLSHNHINAIVGNENFVWLATNKGLNRFDFATGRFTRYFAGERINSLHHNQILALHLDNNSGLWIGTSGGLNYIDQDSWQVSSYFVDQLNGASINQVWQSKDGVLWLGTSELGLKFSDPNKQQLYSVEDFFDMNNEAQQAHITALSPLDDNTLWLGTKFHGIKLIDIESGEVKRHVRHLDDLPNGLNSNQITHLFKDSSGLLWIGHQQNGLNLFNPANQAFRGLYSLQNDLDSLSNPSVFSMLEADTGEIWVGYHGNGIDIISPDIGVVDGFRPDVYDNHALIDGTVNAMVQLANQDIWVGTWRGLHKYRPYQHDFERYGEADGLINLQVRALLAGQNNQLWIGTQGGLSLYDANQKSFRSFTKPDGKTFVQSVRTLAQTKDGTVWVGTFDGLYALPKGSQELIKFSNDQFKDESPVLFDNHIKQLLVTKDNQLYFSTKSGLGKLTEWKDNQAEFSQINSAPLSLTMDNLLEDNNGDIWSGAIRYQVKLNSLQFSKGADQIPLGTPWPGSKLTLRSGFLAFGGTNGILLVDPSLNQQQQKPASIRITKLSIDGVRQPVSDQNQLSLEPSQLGFTMQFSLLDFANQTSDTLVYKLHGYDKNWRKFSSDMMNATYTNLNPGVYQLAVKAPDNQNITPLNIRIAVQPAWYQRLSVQIALVAALFGAIYLIYITRVAALNRQTQLLQQKVDERTTELFDANRNLEAISAIGRDITATLELDAVVNLLYQEVGKAMDANSFAIGLISDDQKQIEFKLVIKEGLKLQPYNRSMEDEAQLTVHCVKQNKSILIGDYQNQYQHYLGDVDHDASIGLLSNGHTKKPQFSSCIYVPLRLNQQVTGVMAVLSPSKNAYRDDNLIMMNSLASYSAIAIDNCGKAEQLQSTQNQLAMRAKMASLGTLTAGVAHEINNPNNFAHVALGLLKEEQAKLLEMLIDLAGGDEADQEIVDTFKQAFAKLDEHTDTAIEGTDRIKNIVKDLRTFTRMDSNDKRRVAISEPIESTVNLVKTRFKRIAFVQQISADPELECVPAKLGQVFMNLIVNACDAIEKQQEEDTTLKGQITISTEQIDDQILIHIADNGMGMSQQTAAKIFEPFFTTKAVGKGTGLGLAISYGVIQDHNGDITVTSALGEGTRFSILLPLNNDQ